MLIQNILRLIFTLCMITILTTGCSSTDEKKKHQTESNDPIVELPKKPNILVIMTDQERYPTHWPKGWEKDNLPSMERLKKHGLTFHRAYTAACECTPSRAVLSTSEHYPINKTPMTPSVDGLPSDNELTDIGSLLKKHTEYEVIWKGKWHLSPPVNGGHDWTEKDIGNLQQKYDIYEWNPPDAGNALSEHINNPNGSKFNGLTTLGGGFANNDGRFVNGMSKDEPKQTPGFGESILAFINKVAQTPPKERKPFCMFVSLVNPHDVWVYPPHWEEAGYKKEDFTDLGIDLPNNYHDDLTTKPSVQLKVRDAFNKRSPLNGPEEEKTYVNFYAYLHKLADAHVGTILDALDKAGLTEDTIIIRTADHGEMGLSHGMREKAYIVYEEVIHIPLVISNPKMYPTPQSTYAFYSHLDLMPTIAELTGVPDYNKYGKGISIVPTLKNPATEVQDSILFTYDDVFSLPKDVPGGHIRAIRDGNWTYAVYYSEDGSHFEYEMYNLKYDPSQLNNILSNEYQSDVAEQANKLHQKLTEKINQAQALPKDFPWPKDPHKVKAA